MNKFTRGPWTVDNCHVYGDGRVVAYTGGLFGAPEGMAQANAKLISAVPDLHLACEGALVALLLGDHVDKNQVIKHLREVLAKVENE